MCSNTYCRISPKRASLKMIHCRQYFFVSTSFTYFQRKITVFYFRFFVALGHSRPSMFRSFYNLKWVWMVLNYFSRTVGLIRIGRHASNRNKIMFEMCVRKGLISPFLVSKMIKMATMWQTGCSREADFGCENKHPHTCVAVLLLHRLRLSSLMF